MKNFNFLSTRLFLMLGLAVPIAFAMTSQAQAKPVKAESVQNKPFIQQNARPDTLGNLNKVPIGNVLGANDGGTGKETSDTGKESCDKCKESSDGYSNPADQVILPANRIKIPGQVQKIKSNQLIKSAKPIF